MKILYGVQGTGNGHITRARIMAKAFADAGVQVDWVCLLYTSPSPRD
jgi:UDP:flavonoid glycosyltransferase YjiC (YdhE family)